MITNYLYHYKLVLNNMGIYFSKKKNHKHKHLKTYIFVKLLKQDENK